MPHLEPYSARTVFDEHLAGMIAFQSTPWGRLRYELVHGHLLRHLPSGTALRIVDVGGGNGVDAVRLARLGHTVTIVDPSRNSLEEAEVLAAEHGCADRVRLVAADASDLGTVIAPESADAVLAHTVMQYIDARDVVLEAMAAVLRPGGVASVLTPNPVSDPMIAAVRCGDLDEAIRLLGTGQRPVALYGTEIDMVGVEQLVVEMGAAGLGTPVRYGVRAVCDLIADDEIKHDPTFFATLLRLETLLADREPYLSSARFAHLISTKPA